MAIQFQKKYWSINQFSRNNGEDYQGYVGIYNGQGYIYDTQQLLVKKTTYYTQFNTSDYFFDRILDQEIKLPYSKKDVQFHANDFLYRGTIKNILQKLQANNDYIYKCSTLSDTLIPAVNDCSILATTNNSYYVFIGESLKEYKEIPNLKESQNMALKDIQNGFIKNPDYDSSYDKDKNGNDVSDEKLTYPIKSGDFPKQKYPSKWKFVPNTKYILDLEYGKLTRYNLNNQKQTKTALDPTFYPQVMQDGTKTEPIYNFHDIVNIEMIITDVGMQDIIVSDDGVRARKIKETPKQKQQLRSVKRIKLIIFFAFKTKVVIMRYTYYPDDFYVNEWLGDNIDFTENTKDLIVLDVVDPSNKNSLNFLQLRDIRVRGNYMYLVDQKLNMVLRYDIEFIRTQQGVSSWDKRSVRLLDLLQGQGEARDDIYFNAPCSICADDDFIYVADRGNGCIKKYSQAFDYVKTIRNGNFTTQDIQTISINPYSFTMDDGTVLPPNTLWIFATTGTSLYVHVVDDQGVKYSHRIDKLEMLKDKFMWDQQFKSAKFSFSNSNYYYISTTKRVYKLHLNKPHYPFASLSYFKQRLLLSTMVWSKIPYPWHILPCGEDESGVDITWGYRPATTSAEILDNKGFCLCGIDSYDLIDNKGNHAQFNGDIILQIGTLYNQQKIDRFCKRNNCTYYDIPQTELSKMINCSGVFLYNETTSWLSSLTKLDFPAYISQDIEDIDPSEYVNSTTFNKLVYKVIYNLVNLKNHIIGRFWGAYNLDGLMCYDQLEYDDFFQQLRIDKNDDFFVHDNEPMSIMINRIFERIWDIQEKILIRMESKYRAMGAFTNNSFRII